MSITVLVNRPEKPSHIVYIYEYGQIVLHKGLRMRYNIDIHRGGTHIRYINVRSYWMLIFRTMLEYKGNGIYVPKKIKKAIVLC